MTTLPCPTIDHVVVNVHDRLDAAADRYRALGFTLTPRGYHSLGSMNHLAIFGTDYLELIAAPTGSTRQDVMGWPIGLNGLVWGAEDSAATHAALTEAGVEHSPPMEFTRPVELPEGARDARFRTVRLPNEATKAGRLYFCHHFTRDLVWRDEWRQHANGTVGVAGFVFAAADPARLGRLFARMFGCGQVYPITGGHRLVAGLASVDVVTPAEAAARFGAALPPPDGRDETMVALVLRTISLDMAAKAQGAVREAGRVVVPAGDAFGAVIQFVE